MLVFLTSIEAHRLLKQHIKKENAMNWKQYLSWILISISMSSCTKKHNMDASQEQITLGMMSGPEASIAYEVVKVAEKKFNLNIRVIEFDDYSIPNIALNEGGIDAKCVSIHTIFK